MNESLWIISSNGVYAATAVTQKKVKRNLKKWNQQ